MSQNSRSWSQVVSKGFAYVFFTAFIVENTMTMIFFSHDYRRDFRRNFGWDIEVSSPSLPVILLYTSVISKLYAITCSRYGAIFHRHSHVTSSRQFSAKISAFVQHLKQLDDDAPTRVSSQAQLAFDDQEQKRIRQLLFGHDPKPDYYRHFSSLHQRYYQRMEGLLSHSFSGEFSSQRWHGVFKTIGFFDSISALMPSVYFGALTGYLLGVQDMSKLVLWMVLGFVCKIPCSWVYFFYRVPSNAEFMVWLNAFGRHGYPKQVSRRLLAALVVFALLTALVDASTVFYPGMNALRFYRNMTTGNIEKPQPVNGHDDMMTYCIAAVTSILYGVTSFGNTLSSSFYLLFPRLEKQSVVRHCQPVSYGLGLASLLFAALISVFSVMSLFRSLGVLAETKSARWSQGHIVVAVTAVALAMLPTWKSFCYTLPKVLAGGQRAWSYLIGCYCRCSCSCSTKLTDPLQQPLKSSSSFFQQQDVDRIEQGVGVNDSPSRFRLLQPE